MILNLEKLYLHLIVSVPHLRKLIATGEYDADIAKYIPGTLEFVLQGILGNIDAKVQNAHIFYKDMKHLEIQIMLTNNYYTNPNSMHLSFPMKIKKSTNNDADIDTDLITVNNFFANLIKEISITRYGNDKQLMLTFSSYEIYQYSDAMLKHLPEKSLKNFKKQCYIVISFLYTTKLQ